MTTKYSCQYEGAQKAVMETCEGFGRVSKFYCKAHVEDFRRLVPTSHVVTPRKVGEGPWPCQADWPLPGEVP